MGKWSVQEDKALRKAVEDAGSGVVPWDRLAVELYGGRHNGTQCQARWNKVRCEPGSGGAGAAANWRSCPRELRRVSRCPLRLRGPAALCERLLPYSYTAASSRTVCTSRALCPPRCSPLSPPLPSRYPSLSHSFRHSAGHQARARQGPLEARGGRDHPQVPCRRHHKVERDRGADRRTHRQAVPRALFQPPRP